MGDSGDAGDDSEDSASDADRFEFSDFVPSSGDDIADVVDFSGPGTTDEPEGNGDADDEPDEDDIDPPDEPDPDSNDNVPENPAKIGGGGATTASDDGTGATQANAANADSSGSASSAAARQTDDPEADAPDPPDQPDGQDDGSFYDIDPVDGSKKAVDFAENQSKAAYEFAYEGATKNPLARLIRRYTSPEVRNRIDEVFSRRMLGSVLVGGAFSKIIESCIGVYFNTASQWRPVAWAVVFVLATTAFVWWDHLAEKATEAAESATEAATEAADKASKKAEEAGQAASQAADAAAEATGSGSKNSGEGSTTSGSGNAERPTGQRAATRGSGGLPGIKRVSRGGGPNRRPNKRFQPSGREMGMDEQFPEDTGFEQVELDEAPGQTDRFEDPVDAAE